MDLSFTIGNKGMIISGVGHKIRGNVWFMNKPTKNDLHPTMKPVELVERAIRNIVVSIKNSL